MYLLCYYQLLCDYGIVLIMILFFLFYKYTYALRFFLENQIWISMIAITRNVSPVVTTYHDSYLCL